MRTILYGMYQMGTQPRGLFRYKLMPLNQLNYKSPPKGQTDFRKETILDPYIELYLQEMKKE